MRRLAQGFIQPRDLSKLFSSKATVAATNDLSTTVLRILPDSAPVSSKGVNHTVVEWADGHISTFNNQWLRDHCLCEQCVDKHTLQRSFDSLSLPRGAVLAKTTVSSGTLDPSPESTIFFHWCDNESRDGVCRQNEFPAAWLRSHCYSEKSRAHARLDFDKKHPPWDAQQMQNVSQECSKKFKDTPSIRITYDAFMDDVGLLEALRVLDRYGLVLIDGVPPNEADVEATVGRIGPPRETTPWGRMWDTAPDEAPKDTAYTNVALLPHIDCCYLEDQVGLQVFVCATMAESGGANTFVDGFKVAEQMRARHPQAFEFFCNTSLPYYCIHEGVNVRSEGPVFRLGQDGNVGSVKFNNYDRASLIHLTSAQIDKFYDYLPMLYKAFRDPSLAFRHTLQEGQMVIVDNWRVLHGRESFEGYRNFIGCYVGTDDYRSRLRVLEQQHQGIPMYYGL